MFILAGKDMESTLNSILSAGCLLLEGYLSREREYLEYFKIEITLTLKK